MRRVVVLAAIGVLWCAAARGGAPEIPFEVKGGAERANLAHQDAQKLFKMRFPKHEEIGGEWKRPWELRFPGASASEAEFWKQVALKGLRPQFFGVDRAAAEELSSAMFDDLHKKLIADMGSPAAQAMPAGLRELIARRESLPILALAQTRLITLPVIESPPAFAARNQEMGFKIARQMLTVAALPPDQQKKAQGEIALLSFTLAIDGLCPDAQGKTFDQLKALFVDEVRLVRRHSRMIYAHIPPEEAKKVEQSRQYVPKYGTITIDLCLIEPSARGRAKDLDAAGVKELAVGMQKAFENNLAIFQEIAKLQAARGQGDPAAALAAAGTRPAIAGEPRALGDNSWLLSVSGVPIGPQMGVQYFGRVRNGIAVVNLQGMGTMPAEWFAKQMDFFLSAMDERTRVYRDEAEGLK